MFSAGFRALSRFRWTVVVMWLALAGASLWPALHFVQSTSQKFKPPRGTDAAKAAEAFARNFPESQKLFTAVLLTASTNESVLLGSFSEALTKTLRDELVPAATAEARAPKDAVVGVLGYFTLCEQNPTIADGFVSSDGRATVVLIPTAEFSTVETWAGSLARHVDSWVEKHRLDFNDSAGVTAEVTGMPLMLHDSVEGVERDLAVMDSIALPLALAVLGCVLHGLPLMAVPLLCAAVSFSLSFSALYFVAEITPVASFVPPICLSVVIAFSFDCAAFIGSRWQEELSSRRAPRDFKAGSRPKLFHRPVPATEEVNSKCVEVALRHSGRNVATSGLVLFACLLSLVALPVQFISMVGASAALTLFVTVATSLVLAPALLLCMRPVVTPEGLIPGVDLTALLPERLRKKLARRSISTQAFWRWLGILVTKKTAGFLATAAVVVFTLALSFFAQKLATTVDVTLMMPHDAPSLVALRHMFDTSFPPGMAEPYDVLATPKAGKNATIWSQDFFESSLSCVHELCTNVGGLDEGNALGLTQALGAQVPWSFARQLLDPKSGWGATELGEAYRLLAKFTSRADGGASFVLLPTSFNPMENVTGFVSSTRSILDNCSAESNFSFMLAGDMADMEGAVSAVLAKFPMVIGVAFAIVAITLLAAFRTVALPFRSLVTIALTLGAAFGLGTIFFVLGTSAAAEASMHALFWFTPICSFVVILGLATDYDLFLFTRIYENRSAGMTTEDAVAKAVEKTGGIITAAGSIMAISFGGLCLSSIPTVQQMGFMLTAAVLFDTLVVRTLLVPSVIAILGESNWWPRRFSPEKQHLLVNDA